MKNMGEESISEKDRINKSISGLRDESGKLLECLRMVNEILIKRSDLMPAELEKNIDETKQGWLSEVNDRLKVIKETISECISFADPIVRALQSSE